ncbi:MAG: hypothetical protein JRH20_26815, partial [Deltaproteobacteria bacterium]|nr:hypothetical protein [Deltaproteobacteria bacterium]
SKPGHLDEVVGQGFRLLVCTRCGATRLHAQDVKALQKRGDIFEPVEVYGTGGAGPFR